MGSIYRRGDVFWVKYYRNGKPYRESTHSQKESDAKRLLKLREGQIVEGKFHGLKAEKTTYKELAEDYLTYYKVNGHKSYFRADISARHLATFFENYRASNIDTSAVNRYIATRQEQGAENATINRELGALKRMFSLAAKCTPPKVVNMPYIPKLKENNVRTGYFEHQDYVRMRDALPGHLRPLFVTAYFTGLRKGELLSLTWDKVNLFEKKITLSAGTTKNDQARIIFLAGELLDVVMEQYTSTSKEHPNCVYVFHKNGERIGDFRKAWDKALAKCGYRPAFKCRTCGNEVQLEAGRKWKIEQHVVTVRDGKKWEEMICPKCDSNSFKRNHKVFHDNRRTAVRNLVRTGTSERVAMNISGHKTRTIFDRYNITSEADLRQACERLAFAHEALEEVVQAQNGHNLGK